MVGDSHLRAVVAVLGEDEYPLGRSIAPGGAGADDGVHASPPFHTTRPRLGSNTCLTRWPIGGCVPVYLLASRRFCASVPVPGLLPGFAGCLFLWLLVVWWCLLLLCVFFGSTSCFL